MAHKVDGLNLPFVAASTIRQYVPVMFLPGGSALSETVQAAASFNSDAFGFTIATVGTYGQEVAVAVDGVTKAIAGASLGAGCNLGVGSTNGILVPIVASNLASAADGVGAGLRYKVGRALKNAAAGDVFPVLIDPDQIV
jgi:hypothetical protein